MKKGFTSAAPKRLVMGALLALVISLVGAMILAYLMGSERVGADHMAAWVFALRSISVFIGATYAATKIDGPLPVIGILAGFYLLVLVMGALAFGNGVSGFLPGALAVLAGGGMALLLHLAGNRSGGRRHKFRRFR